MNIPFLQAHTSNFRSGRGGNSIKYIVMHYTAGNGDTAMNNAQYFHNNNGLQASAHYFVDENSVVQSVRDTDAAWHCGGVLESNHHPYHNICMNSNSLGVEMCSDKVNGKYVITAQTVDRAVELVKTLMAKYGIDAAHVIRHYDVTGKDCPEPWVRNPQLWQKFKDMLTEKEVEDMTEAQTRAIAKQEIANAAKKVYNTIEAVPAWAKPTVQKLVSKGYLQGDDQGKLNLDTDLLRVLVVNDRAHLYG